MTEPNATPHILANRQPKRAREIRNNRKVEVSIYLDPDLLAQLNEAWLQSSCPFFSRWVAQKLQEALKCPSPTQS